MDAAVLVT